MHTLFDTWPPSARDTLLAAGGALIGFVLARCRHWLRSWHYHGLEEMLERLSPGDPRHHLLADGWLLAYIGCPRIMELHRHITGTDAVGELGRKVELGRTRAASAGPQAPPVHSGGGA